MKWMVEKSWLHEEYLRGGVLGFHLDLVMEEPLRL